MILSSTLTSILIILSALVSMTFYTLLERKCLGYFQLRKGPNKVGIAGLPQPFADAIKLFTKERTNPMFSNLGPFLIAPITSLLLALMLWMIYPHPFPYLMSPYSAIIFLAISSMSVYATLSAGWASNSKYSLLGALRSVAQTISYEISMALLLLTSLLINTSFNMNLFMNNYLSLPFIMMTPVTMMWFVTTLAETNRTPFDFAEGESELVSGFNTEYSSSSFALIFMAEYSSIIIMSIFTTVLFINFAPLPPISYISMPIQSTLIAFMFIWMRASFPRMRYDRLMMLTWKSFLPFAIVIIIFITPLLTLT